jgi:hypothetical protein
MSESVLGMLKRKAGEPSTWKGLGWLLVALGVMPVGAIEGLSAAGVALVGVVEMIRREKLDAQP